MSDLKQSERMERIVSLCKRRGFVFQSSEIYGGINGFWDYGPLGAELKRNVKDRWWRWMTRDREDVVGLEATIIMHPKIWEASGHTATFSDPMVDCLLSKKRLRADQIDPMTGTAWFFSGAKDLEDGRELNEAYSAFQPEGKEPKVALKTAREYYRSRGLKNPEPVVERSEPMAATTRYNPENGSLLTEARPFNLMFKTYVGPVECEENVAYLRPETAQAIFAQFKNVLEVSRQGVPFGICQIGKAFRNEINPRNFTFRSREFEQMELEYFIPPDEAVAALAGSLNETAPAGHPGEPSPNWGWQLWHKYWVEERIRFYESIGLPRTTLEEYWQKPEELAHYAKATVDLLYQFPFGTQELEGIAARGDFDLSQHQKFSGKGQEVFDEALRGAWGGLADEAKQALRAKFLERKRQAILKKGVAEADATTQAGAATAEFFEKLAKGVYVPHVIEPSAGADRLILALICQAYTEEQVTDEKGKVETRVVMKFHPRVAPVKVGVFPLLKNRPELVAKAREVLNLLRPHMAVFYDDTGAIGRRYRRQDEAGTPYGVTIDFDTLGENGDQLKDTVTLRDRDTMKQERIPIGDLPGWLMARLS